MSCSTSTCPEQSTPAPMPMVGMLRLSVTSRASARGNRLEHEHAGARLLERLRVLAAAAAASVSRVPCTW